MVRRKRLLDRLDDLASRLEPVLELTEARLRQQLGLGVGAREFQQTTAFRWDADSGPGRLVPIETPADFDLDDLVGVERPLARLLCNTEQFLGGHPSNHVLLYGERGTGKSSAVRGLLTRYASRGLRLVDVQKADLIHLPRILGALRKAPAELGFLLFCDDLSFAAGEPGLRELKAALEGNVDALPESVRIIATSNRRHLVPQTMDENRAAWVDEQNELHHGEALEEKLALSDRFGLMLGFYGFDQSTYLEIVERYVKKAGLEVEFQEVRADALRWALARSNRSGRSARQFVDDLAGRLALAASGERLTE